MTSNEEPLDLAAIRARVDSATDGPWGKANSHEWGMSHEDLTFILAARTDVPALLDALATAQADLTKSDHNIEMQKRQIDATKQHWMAEYEKVRLLYVAAQADLAARDAVIAGVRALMRGPSQTVGEVEAILAQSPADALDPFAPVRDQRERQIAMGFDAAHDDAHGREHLIEGAKSYAVRGELVKAAAMVMALSHYDERRKREARTTPAEGAGQ